jgi:hypothetical protein
MKTESPKAVAAKFKKQLGSEAKDIVNGLVLRSTGAKKKHWAAVLDELNGGAPKVKAAARPAKKAGSKKRSGPKPSPLAVSVAKMDAELLAIEKAMAKVIDRTPMNKAYVDDPEWKKLMKARDAMLEGELRLYPGEIEKSIDARSKRMPPGKKPRGGKKASRKAKPATWTAPKAKTGKKTSSNVSDDDKGAMVWAWLKNRGDDLTFDAKLWSADEWHKRGEDYGEGALFTITTEGPLNGIINGHYSGPEVDKTLRDFDKMLKGLGIYYELGNSWSLHFYPR